MGPDFSSLRTRIAAVLQTELDGNWHVESLRLADAVIRELGLREERRGPVTAYREGQYYPDCSLVRFISDWETRDD